MLVVAPSIIIRRVIAATTTGSHKTKILPTVQTLIRRPSQHPQRQVQLLSTLRTPTTNSNTTSNINNNMTSDSSSKKAKLSSESSTTNGKKKSWKVFWDLQCPYSKKNWEQYEALKAKFGDEYDFSIHLTSLLFHPQAFMAQCAANLVATEHGDGDDANGGAQGAKLTFINEAFKQQSKYMNDAVGDAKKSEIIEIFANIVDDAKLFTDTFTKETFRKDINDWKKAVSPAWNEYKVAAEQYHVMGTPKTAIDEKLIDNTESSWGPTEWETKLQELVK